MGRAALAIFDLDGVLVDTAKYHYLAWKRLAAEFGYPLTEQDNESFKGVSRIRCMELLCSMAHLTMTAQQISEYADLKNKWYVESIGGLSRGDLLPGAEEVLRRLKARGVLLAIGSASRNTRFILQRVELESEFDCVIDGTRVSRAKPDPEVFLLSARELNIAPDQCVVFEDAASGVEAAHNAGMRAVGVGDAFFLAKADFHVKNLTEFRPEQIFYSEQEAAE